MASLNISYDYFSNYSDLFRETLYTSYDSILSHNNFRMYIFLYMYFIASAVIFYNILSCFIIMDNSEENKYNVENQGDVGEFQEEETEDIKKEEKTDEDQEEETDEDQEEETDEDQEETDEDQEEETDDEEIYPELYNFFQFQLTKKKLVKIVGSKYKNLSKKDLVKFALEKFKNETINNSLENFKYFSSNFKSYLKSNHKLYQSELVKLFNKGS